MDGSGNGSTGHCKEGTFVVTNFSGPVQRRIGEDVDELDESSPIVPFTHRVWISLVWTRASTMDGNVRLPGWDCCEEGISLWRSWVLHRTD